MASDDSPQAGVPTGAAERPPGSELALSAERWASLAPKLRTLLDDFRRLEALDDPALEPATPVELLDDGADVR